MSLISSQHVNHLSVDDLIKVGDFNVTNALTAGTVTVAGAATLGSLSLGAPVTVSAATATISATTSVVICSFAGTMTLTLPAASSLTGRILLIKADVAQNVNSASNNVQPLNGGGLGNTILGGADGSFVILVSTGTYYVIMAAN
jgi:hypothetical protein